LVFVFKGGTWTENRVLRRIVGPKRDEVTRGWGGLHNVELHNLYASSSIIRMIKSIRMKCTGHVAQRGDRRGTCRILVGKPERKRPRVRSRRRWVDNIKMYVREMGWSVVWTGLIWLRIGTSGGLL
jgi:hypothetical protein